MIGLDSNAVIDAIRRRRPAVVARLARATAEGEGVGMPAIVLFELWSGVHMSADPPRNATLLATFLGLGLEHWPFDAEDAAEAGEIRAALARAGTPIGPYDVLIAAQARRRGAVLVTANIREFARVPGLAVEDWSAA